MSEKERNKAGLHKKISSIFNGVMVPQPDSDKKPSGISVPEDTHDSEPKQPVQESQIPESSKPNQTEQILPKAESTQESEAEPVQEPKAEPVQESEEKPARTPKFMTAQESKVVPIQESEAEPVQEPKAEPAQESEAKSAHAPKFMTAQESKVVPIQESEEEPVQEPKAEPVQESEAKPAHRPQLVAAKKAKVETTQQSKVMPVQRPEADNENIAKKHTVVKVVSHGFLEQITNKLFTPKPEVNATKQKVMVVMVPVLFILLLIFIFRGGVFGTSVHSAQASEENNNSAVTVPDLNNKIDWEIPEIYPKKLRDPMQLGPVERTPDQTESGGLVKLIVKGILYSEENSSVVIGNKIVHEGEQVRGVNIIKINEDSVEFEMNGRIWSQKVQR
jgi:hypothetical protein